MVADCLRYCPDWSTYTDEQLVTLALLEREGAFRILFDRHAENYRRVALSIVRNEADAQDVVQTAFLKIVGKLSTFSGEGSFAGWSYRIVRNSALMHLRKQKRRREVAMENAPPRPARETTRTPHDDLSDREIRETVAMLLGRLEPKYRVALELREIDGLSMEQLSAELQLSVGGAKTRLHRARSNMRVWLEHEYGITPA